VRRVARVSAIASGTVFGALSRAERTLKQPSFERFSFSLRCEPDRSSGGEGGLSETDWTGAALADDIARLGKGRRRGVGASRVVRAAGAIPLVACQSAR
jgi:hypothetical protein